jgi:hypothetical protein
VIRNGLALNDPEMRAGTLERDTWGAAWRQRDYNFFTSQPDANASKNKYQARLRAAPKTRTS